MFVKHPFAAEQWVDRAASMTSEVGWLQEDAEGGLDWRQLFRVTQLGKNSSPEYLFLQQERSPSGCNRSKSCLLLAFT